MATCKLVLFLVLLSCTAIARGEPCSSGYDDIIDKLPGLNYKPTFDQYSGYLNATDGRHLFYWLVESQGNPHKDPIVLWLNGGPGCSSLGGLTTELGPFHVNPDGHTLFENVFAWNKFANVFFIESPTGVGFSYSDSGNDTATDDSTAYYNYQALRDFFYNKFPEYQSHDFYITGESYAGIYIPTLSKLVIQGIATKDFPDNFKGLAIGNGMLSHKYQYNSLINMMYYHGMTGPDEWNSLIDACCKGIPSDTCDFYAQRNLTNDCGKQIQAYMAKREINDEYNMYQDCYSGSSSSDTTARRAALKVMYPEYPFESIPSEYSGSASALPPGTKDMAHQMNYDSTDANFGFYCWASAKKYFNDVNVMKAVHADSRFYNKTWCSCCTITYIRDYTDMAEQFSYILRNSKVRILVYNGDVDTVCNFLGDQWFVERDVVPPNRLQVVKERQSWKYRQQIAGFVKRFDRIDQVTVKGSGHMVPEDRAGPALQMIYNFIQNTGDYSKATGIDVNPKPLASSH